MYCDCCGAAGHKRRYCPYTSSQPPFANTSSNGSSDFYHPARTPVFRGGLGSTCGQFVNGLGWNSTNGLNGNASVCRRGDVSYASIASGAVTRNRRVLIDRSPQPVPADCSGNSRDTLLNQNEPEIIFESRPLNPRAPMFVSNAIYNNDMFDGFPPINRLS